MTELTCTSLVLFVAYVALKVYVAVRLTDGKKEPF